MLSSLRPSRFVLRFLVTALLLAATPLRLQSQVSTSSDISGVVTDQTGGAIEAAKVVFTSDSFAATEFTKYGGTFAFSRVSAETGVVQASAPGFQISNVDWRSGSGPLQIVLRPASAAD